MHLMEPVQTVNIMLQYMSWWTDAVEGRRRGMAQIRLKTRTASEVRKTLTRVMNMVANGQMDSKRANTIILGCNAVLSSIRADDQQKKIDELERILNGIK